MNIIDIINKKRERQLLTKEEINFFIDGYMKEEIKDYQVSSLLMAICINGMVEEEIFNLTEAMLNSGDVLNLSNIEGIVVDKHSTGGVGDKVSLVALPLAAACGVKTAKMSGKGLGYTGGTLDKLESIPGFKINLSNEEFEKQVNEINMAIVAQTQSLVPADKKLYSLRDVTGTVSSQALIAASIMSKKLASGADALVLDVKVGDGAFMKKLKDAKILADLMVKIGKKFNKKVIALLTNMHEPLGYKIGNSLEIEEVIDTLQGKGPKDITELGITVASCMVALAKDVDIEDATKMVTSKLKSGLAFAKFKEFVNYQGGDLEKIAVSKTKINIKSLQEGYISQIKADDLGNICISMGAGRLIKDEAIDYQVGMELHKKIGDYVTLNEVIITLYINDEDKNDYTDKVLQAFEIRAKEFENKQLIYAVIK